MLKAYVILIGLKTLTALSSVDCCCAEVELEDAAEFVDARSGGSDAEAEVVVDIDAEPVDPVVEFMMQR